MAHSGEGVARDPVRAAAQRIEAGRHAIEKPEKDKAAAKEADANAAKAAEAIAEQWADRLALYKADTAENSKRRFGAPMSDADLIESPPSNRSMRKPWLCTRSL